MGGIKFTQREIDTISCLINGRASKKTSNFLNISPRTVETHIRNIMNKIECHSRDGIIDFIENSGKHSHFKQYYEILLVHLSFENNLKKLSNLSGPKHVLVLFKEDLGASESFCLKQIKSHLTECGIQTTLKSLKVNKSQDSFFHKDSLTSVDFVIRIISSKDEGDDFKDIYLSSSSHTQSLKLTDNQYLFLFLGLGLDKKNELEKQFGEQPKVCFELENNYYQEFINLLKNIFAPHDISSIFSTFRTSRDLKTNIYEPLTQPISLEKKFSSIINYFSYHKYLTFFAKRKKVFSILSIVIFASCVGSLVYTNDLFHPFSSHKKNGVNSTRFLLRPKFINLIDERLKDQSEVQTIALIGPGGAGKTTLARQYGQSQKSSVYWEVNAEANETLRSDFEKLAQTLLTTQEDKKLIQDIKENKDPQEREEKVIEFVRMRLKIRPNWLLLFDNVENFSDIEKYFPTDVELWGKGRVILTSRNINLQSSPYIKHAIQIEPLSASEKLELYTKILNEDNSDPLKTISEEETSLFLEQLPSFPLDVSIAAYYIKATNISFPTYLNHINSNNADFPQLQQKILMDVSDYSKTRFHIVVVAIRELIETHKDFEDLLLLISLLDSQHIPKALLDHFKSDIIVDNFIYNLKKYSLITHDASTGGSSTYSIHRSTQKIILAYLSQILKLKENPNYLNKISLFLEKYSNELSQKNNIGHLQELLPHYQKFLTHKTLLTEQMEGRVEGELGNIYYNLGDYKVGKHLLEQSLLKLKKSPTENTSRIASVLVNLATNLWDLGEFEKAKERLEESIQIYKNYLPKDKIGHVKALICLGSIHGELENFPEAEQTLHQSLQFLQIHLPNCYEEIAQTQVHLGIIYRNMGRFDKGKEILNESLVTYQNHLPKSYISLAWALTNLGNIHRDLGNYPEALKLYEKSLQLYLKHSPDNLAEIGRIFARIGTTQRDLGYPDKARDFLRQSLEIYKTKLPNNHVAFAWALSHLATVYRIQGKLGEAKDALEKGLLIYSKNLPDYYVEVARAKGFLGVVYAELGNYEEAHKLLQYNLNIYAKNYGKNHIEPARILHNIGYLYLLENKLDQSEQHLQQAFKIFDADDHTDKYLVLENLANLYLKKSKLAEESRQISESQKYKQQALTFLNQALQVVKSHLPYSPNESRIQKKIQNII